MAEETQETVFRRLQKVGKATYSVSLPKRWVVKRGLRPGDTVEINEELDGSLRIKPLEIKSKPLSCKINAELCRTPAQLVKLVTACYRAGYDSIEISFAGGAALETLKAVKDVIAKGLPGFELVEETGSRLFIRNVLDHSRYPLDDLLRRIQLAASAIFSNLIEFITTRRYELIPYIKDLRARAAEILQLHTRLLILYLKKREIGGFLKPKSAAHIYSSIIVARILNETINDLVAFAESISKIRKRVWARPEVHRVLSQLLETASRLLGDSMDSYFSVDFERANYVLSISEDAFSTVIEEILREKLVRDIVLNRFLIQSAILLRNITARCHEIAQLTLDMFVESENPILQKR